MNANFWLEIYETIGCSFGKYDHSSAGRLADFIIPVDFFNAVATRVLSAMHRGRGEFIQPK
jgi:hypothetical protein